MSSTDCNKTLILPGVVFWLAILICGGMFVLTLVCFIWLLRKGKNNWKLSLYMCMLAVSNISLIIWIQQLQQKEINQCATIPDTRVERRTVILGALTFNIMFLFNLMPYWRLAIKYWELSYSLEELIKPFEREIRPKWHFLFDLLVTACIVLVTLLNSIFYGYDMST